MINLSVNHCYTVDSMDKIRLAADNRHSESCLGSKKVNL